MAVVQGVKEKVHLPIYDSLTVEPAKQLRDAESSSTLRFFVNVQGKTKLETNLQSASLLPHYNTFEARAMRVVISDLPPEFSDEPTVKDEGFDVTDGDGNRIDYNGNIEGEPGSAFNATNAVTADIELSLKRVMELLAEAREADEASLSANPAEEEGVSLLNGTTPLTPAQIKNVVDAGGVILLTVADLEGLISILEPERKQPPKEQVSPNNGAGTLIGKFIYNTVTTFYVGEKIMIQMPTWFFPAGAGPYSETAKFTTHGEPSPTATFRFAEPIFIDKQQNFRVEIEIPDADVQKEVQKIYGPLFIWVVLDGYMVRDVQ
jgi:hypothetical protein